MVFMVIYLIVLGICVEHLLSLNCCFAVWNVLVGFRLFVICGLLGLGFALVIVFWLLVACGCWLWFVYSRLLLGWVRLLLVGYWLFYLVCGFSGLFRVCGFTRLVWVAVWVWFGCCGFLGCFGAFELVLLRGVGALFWCL